MPSQRANLCVGMSDQELDVHLQVPKRMGRPGSGMGPDSDLRALMGRIRSLCPSVLLLSAGKGAHSISTPSVAKLEKGQGMEEDNPDPKPVLPNLWHWGGPVCLCNVRACWSSFACLFQGYVCPCAPAPQLSTLGCLSPVVLCLLGIRQDFVSKMERDAQLAQEWGGV